MKTPFVRMFCWYINRLNWNLVNLTCTIYIMIYYYFPYFVCQKVKWTNGVGRKEYMVLV